MKKKTFIIITCVMIILGLGTQVHAFSFGDAINSVLRAVGMGISIGQMDISKNTDEPVIATLSDNDTKITVSGNGEMKDFANDEEWISDDIKRKLKEVVIEDGVTNIGSRAFNSCIALESLTLGKDVKSIGISSFENCKSLTTLETPNSTSSIGASAFRNCSGLTDLKLTGKIDVIGGAAFEDCKKLSNIQIIKGITNIETLAFSDCDSLINLEISNNVVNIGDMVFYCCKNLKNVIIPESVETIGEDAFTGCESLNEISVSDANENYLSENGILFNKSKTEIIKYPPAKISDSYTIPTSVKTITNNGFEHTVNLKNISIPSNVTKIEDHAFCKSGITSLNLPNSIESIESFCFSYCNGLINVKLPNSISKIDNGTFRDCENLSEIEISSSVESIDVSAFLNCYKLNKIKVDSNNTNYLSENGILFNKDKTKIIMYPRGKTEKRYVIPDTVVEIGYKAFDAVSAIKDILIGNTVTKIEWNAFSGCKNLNKIIIPKTVNTIGEFVINNRKDIYVYYEEETDAIKGMKESATYSEVVFLPLSERGTDISKNSDRSVYANLTDNDTKLTIEGIGEVKNYSDSDVPWNDSKNKIITVDIGEDIINVGNNMFKNHSNIQSINLPNSIETIGSSSFDGCSSLKEIRIPNGVKSILSTAFQGCSSLTSVEIPDSVEKIENSVFKDCSNLKSIKLTGNVKSIEPSTFKNCSSLTDVEIPQGITTIKFEAFKGCSNIKSLSLPTSITEIGDNIIDNKDTITVYYESETDAITNMKNDIAYSNVKFVMGDKIKPVVELEINLNEKKDEATATITSNEEIQPIDGWSLSTNKKKLTKTYKENKTETVTVKDLAGNEVSVEVKVEGIIEKKVESISVKNLPTKTNYYLGGENLDLSGGKITVTYNDKTTEDIDMTNSKVLNSGFSNSTVGKKTITLTYEGKTTTFEVEVIAKSVTGITVKTKPSKLLYIQGIENLNLSGGKITVTFSDNTTEDIDMTNSKVTSSKFDNTKVGKQTITLTYEGKTTTFDVDVIVKTVTGITVKTKPSKLSYIQGSENLNLSGGKITATYSDNTTEDIDMTSSKVTSSKFDNTKVGKQTITLTYEGKTTTFDVDVIAKTVTGITVKTKPSKLSYIQGSENLNLSGGKITATYSDNTTEDIDMTSSKVTSSKFDNTKVGKQTITLTYEGKTTTFDVDVIAKTVTSITVKSKPTKIKYIQNYESLDLTGGKITVTYNNNTSEDIDMTNSKVSKSGFSNSTVGNKTITLTYEGKTTSFDVEIIGTEYIFKSSGDYLINDNKYVINVQPSTILSNFKKQLNDGVQCTVRENNTSISDNSTIKTSQQISVGNNTYKMVVKGDVNGDGIADIRDIMQINKHRLNKTKLENEYLKAGDVNEDGVSDIRDLMQINKYRLGKITNL